MCSLVPQWVVLVEPPHRQTDENGQKRALSARSLRVVARAITGHYTPVTRLQDRRRLTSHVGARTARPWWVGGPPAGRGGFGRGWDMAYGHSRTVRLVSCKLTARHDRDRCSIDVVLMFDLMVLFLPCYEVPVLFRSSCLLPKFLSCSEVSVLFRSSCLVSKFLSCSEVPVLFRSSCLAPKFLSCSEVPVLFRSSCLVPKSLSCSEVPVLFRSSCLVPKSLSCSEVPVLFRSSCLVPKFLSCSEVPVLFRSSCLVPKFLSCSEVPVCVRRVLEVPIYVSGLTLSSLSSPSHAVIIPSSHSVCLVFPCFPTSPTLGQMLSSLRW